MTAVDTPSLETRSATETVVQPTQPPARRVAARRVVRIATIALLVGVVAWAMLELFEGPPARVWYTIRQHQLASEFAATRPHTGRGAAIALLQVPSLGMNLVVAEGDAPQQLRSGPGHRIGTPLPGAIGNSVITGHRTGWGGPLSDVGQLKPGDPIAVQTESTGGPIGVFKVQSVTRVSANDRAPFAGSTDRRLTIVTGTGGRYSDRRLVITSVSGRVGKLEAPTASIRATTSGGSPVWNRDAVLALVAFGAAGALGLVLHRPYRSSTIGLVLVPLVVLGLLGCLLNIDAALPPLR
jgi:LPXTG-site transpeptidase (sortase) family protein